MACRRRFELRHTPPPERSSRETREASWFAAFGARRRSLVVSPASVNRELATLRRLLRLAHEWNVVSRVPRIRLLPGERNREFVLSYKQEKPYLECAPQPLKDIALLMLDTGLRVG